MGHHLTKEGDFLSDKYIILRRENKEDCSPNKIALSFKDPAARKALRLFATHTEDRELAEDILEVLNKE